MRRRKLNLDDDRHLANLVAILSQERLLALTSLALTRVAVMSECEVVDVLDEAAEGLREEGLDPRWRDLLSVASEHQ